MGIVSYLYLIHIEYISYSYLVCIILIQVQYRILEQYGFCIASKQYGNKCVCNDVVSTQILYRFHPDSILYQYCNFFVYKLCCIHKVTRQQSFLDAINSVTKAPPSFLIKCHHILMWRQFSPSTNI